MNPEKKPPQAEQAPRPPARQFKLSTRNQRKLELLRERGLLEPKKGGI